MECAGMSDGRLKALVDKVHEEKDKDQRLMAVSGIRRWQQSHEASPGEQANSGGLQEMWDPSKPKTQEVEPERCLCRWR